MSNHKDVDWLLGRTYSTRFTIVAIGSDKDRTVTLQREDGQFKVSFEELTTIIEHGFVMEDDKVERPVMSTQQRVGMIESLQRRLDMKERQYERLELCPDHRDKASGRCIVCDGEERGKQNERERNRRRVH